MVSVVDLYKALASRAPMKDLPVPGQIREHKMKSINEGSTGWSLND